MAKDIRIIYIVSIIAIIAFLCMQFYWLYNRYEYSIQEYNGIVTEKVQKSLNEYYRYRDNHVSNEWSGKGYRNLSEYSMGYKTDESGNRHNIVSVTAWRFRPWHILGVEPERPLSDNEVQTALQMARERHLGEVDSVYVSEAVDDAPNEAAAWSAAEAVSVEFKNPFEVSGIDSLLTKQGVDAHVTLVNTPKIEWKDNVKNNPSFFNPTVIITIPYSPLEKKSVEVKCEVPTSHLLYDMWRTLIISVLISILLIVCLIWQFKIIFRLDRLDKMRHSFITTMIHELKRPISTLKMCVSGLDNERMLEDKTVRMVLLAESRKALDNLSAYFSKLRDITFNNVEQIPLNFQSLNLHDLFDTVAQAIVHPSGKNVIIRNDITPDTIVSADRAHLYNILNNLIENAVKYSGTEVEINATAFIKDESVEFKVTDNGNGIPSCDLKHIFQQFYRGKASAGEQPGMGLGLAYVRLLVEAHGGDISVQSTEGKGSCFTIKLPQ